MKLYDVFPSIILLLTVAVDAIDLSTNNDDDLYPRVHRQNYQQCLRRMDEYCYDYIIVGAGTAGSILARQLSDDPRNRVLLIEQGYWSSLNPNVQEASKWYSLLSDPLVEIGYVTVPQAGLNNRTIKQPRAKGTGGCNSHNAMAFIVGNRRDFDERWGSIDGWTWDDLSPYWDYINSTVVHTQLDADEPMMSSLLRSAEELGFSYNPSPNDLNSVQGQGGVAPRIYSSKKLSENYARRMSSWNTYVEPILPRDNLDILVFTHVNKVLLDNNLKAIGVETFNAGNKQTAYYYGTREIILSAGVFDTPKLLLLSGIGPCQELQDVNITCLSNVPGVGKNLQDHTFVDVWSPPLRNQNISMPSPVLGGWGAVAIEENGEHYYVLTIDEMNGVKAIRIFVETFHYKSRGTVKLRDKHPLSDPLIDPHYLSNTYDEKKLIATVKLGRSFFSTKVMSSLTESVLMEMSPGYNMTDDQRILEWAKTKASTDYHPSSTCKMGKNFKNDPMIVVDKRLRVRNTKHLRIADASIIPTLISGNPNQITMIIGFKASDMILEDNQP